MASSQSPEKSPIAGRIHRFVRHAAVLIGVLALPALAPRAAVSPLTVASATQTDVVPTAVIERPLLMPTLITRRAAPMVTAAQGVTIENLASTYRTDAAALRWANELPDGAEPAPGSAVLIPPGPGALVRTDPGERPSHFAGPTLLW